MAGVFCAVFLKTADAPATSLARFTCLPMTTTEGITMYAQDVIEHQTQIKDLILQNWIATQSLALEAPAFQPK